MVFVLVGASLFLLPGPALSNTYEPRISVSRTEALHRKTCQK